MKFKAALFFNSAIAFYNVYLLEDDFCKARLHEYSGPLTPPELVQLKRIDLVWTSDCEHKDLVKQLGAAINQRIFA